MTDPTVSTAAPDDLGQKLQIGAIVAGGLGVLSAVLPWASMMGLSVSGLDTGGGKLVLLLAGGALAVAIVSKVKGYQKWQGGSILGGGSAFAMVGLYNFIDLKSATSGGGSPGGSGDAAAEEMAREMANAMASALGVSVGLGLYLAILAGIGTAVVGGMMLKKMK